MAPIPSGIVKFFRMMARDEGFKRPEDLLEIYIDEYTSTFLRQLRKRRKDMLEMNMQINILDTKYPAFRLAAKTLGMTDEELILYIAVRMARTYHNKKTLPGKLL